MAYQKKFNPDALPAHAEPEQAAQAMSQLHIGQIPNNNTGRPQIQSPSHQSHPDSMHRMQQQRPLTTKPIPNNYKSPQQYSQPPRQPQNYRHDGATYSQSPPPPSTTHNYINHNPISPYDQRAQQSPHLYPSRTPALPDPDSGDLYPLFRAANISRSGSLTSSELGSALVNADFTPFDPQTIKSLVRMFSTSPPGQPQGPSISYPEFQNLWKFLGAWRDLFERFDEDRSGRISLSEFSNALSAFGYRLSMPFVGTLYNTFNGSAHERRGSVGRGMSFDLFVQACISLKRMTDVFKTYDDDRDGYVTLSFEEFLTEILKLRD